MIPIDFEINLSKVKVSEIVDMLVCKPKIVRMINRQRIDRVSSNLTQTFFLECR